MKKIEKWIKDYIEGIDLEKIEWIKLNIDELDSFFENNYLYKESWDWVLDDDANSIYPTLLGMSYLNLDNSTNYKDYSFLLGLVNNNIGKKTVVCATIYLDNYFMFDDQEIPITYISSMEVNSFFRNLGLYKKMCNQLINFINNEQHIVTTKESMMGIKCNTFDLLDKILKDQGFEKCIFKDNNGFINSELHNVICSKQKILKK